MKRLSIRDNRHEIRREIKRCNPIMGSNFMATWVTEDLYVVFSYTTPIAWFYAEDRCWEMDDTKYSSTTSKIQNIVREVIDEWDD